MSLDGVATPYLLCPQDKPETFLPVKVFKSQYIKRGKRVPVQGVKLSTSVVFLVISDLIQTITMNQKQKK